MNEAKGEGAKDSTPKHNANAGRARKKRPAKPQGAGHSTTTVSPDLFPQPQREYQRDDIKGRLKKQSDCRNV